MAVFHHVRIIAGHDHQLFGYTPKVDACATPVAAFHYAYTRAMSGGNAGAPYTTGACSNDKKIKVIRHGAGSLGAMAGGLL